jgi:hypothetical protein
VGGFSSKAEAQRALQNKLARLVPGRRAVTLTIGEWVEEYLDAHQGERVTVAKLRWLLGKATTGLGDVRLAELSPEQVCAWRLTVPEGHRFEATQALRQVLNRAVAWKLIDENPAKRGVPNPGRRCREQRPFQSWAQIRTVAGPLLFPNTRGGHLDFRNFNRRHWKPVQKAAGIELLRDLYDLRHTYATFALRAGVPVFALSRFMGTSIAMIDLHYGHLAVDSYQHAVSLLDALAVERAVDAGWTSALGPAKPHTDTVSRPRGRRSRRVVDARWTSRFEPAATRPNRSARLAGTS